MTSTGNTAQKNLIDKFITNASEQQRKQAITQAIQHATSQQEKNTLQAIAKKFDIK